MAVIYKAGSPEANALDASGFADPSQQSVTANGVTYGPLVQPGQPTPATRATQPPGQILVLGPVSFRDWEIPERISFGGRQQLVMQHFPGGAKEIQAMGGDDSPLSWSGRFRGRAAMYQARGLDALRKRGKVLELSWSIFLYDVVISDFRADFEAFYEIPYTVTVEVLKDKAKLRPPPPVTAEQGFGRNLSDTLGLSGLINDSGLGSVMATVQSAATAVQQSGVLSLAGDALAVTSAFAPFAGSSGSALLAKAAGAISTASTATAAIGAAANGQISLGGIASGIAPLAAAAGLSGAAAGLQAAASAQQLGYRLANMASTVRSF